MPAQTLHPTDTITVGGHTLRVQIVGTAEEQAQGLSGIASIAEDEGTLFPFDPPATPSFWMKDMLFPIDIIWIRNNTIIGMSENLPRQLPGQDEDELPLYFPPDHIDAALEINAGLAKNYGFKIGDSVIVAE